MRETSEQPRLSQCRFAGTATAAVIWVLAGAGGAAAQPVAIALEVGDVGEQITEVVCTQGDNVDWGHVVWVRSASAGSAGRVHEWWDGATSVFEVATSLGSGEDQFLRHVIGLNTFGAAPSMKMWQAELSGNSTLLIGSGASGNTPLEVFDSTSGPCYPAAFTPYVDVCLTLRVATVVPFGLGGAEPASPDCPSGTSCLTGNAGLVIDQSVGDPCGGTDSDFHMVVPGVTSAPGGGTFLAVSPGISLATTQLGGLPARVAFVANWGNLNNPARGLFVGVGPHVNGSASFSQYAGAGLSTPGLPAMSFGYTGFDTPTLNDAGALAFGWAVEFDPENIGCASSSPMDSLWLKLRDPAGGPVATPIPIVYPGRSIPLDFDSTATFTSAQSRAGVTGGNACDYHGHVVLKGADIGWQLNASDELAFRAEYCTVGEGGGRVIRPGLFIARPQGTGVAITPLLAFPFDLGQSPVAPGTGGARFVHDETGIWMWINNAGNVAFRANLDDGRTGIWVARPVGTSYVIDLWLITGQQVQLPGGGSATLTGFLEAATAGGGQDGRSIVFNNQRLFVVAGTLESSSFPGSNIRQAAVAVFPSDFPPTSCNPDVNGDGNVDQDDVAYLVGVIGGGPNPAGIDPDFNQDGNVDQDDVAALLNAVAGGGCP